MIKVAAGTSPSPCRSPPLPPSLLYGLHHLCGYHDLDLCHALDPALLGCFLLFCPSTIYEYKLHMHIVPT